MSFIGIITETKNELEVKQNLKKELNRLNIKKTILIINKNSIKNFLNIKFEIVVIDKNIFDSDIDLIKIILKANRIILNSDYDENLKPIKNLKLNVITYGINSKSTLTLSSISENESLFTLQRAIKNIKNELIEPQEIKMEAQNIKKNIYLYMILAIFFVIFDKF